MLVTCARQTEQCHPKDTKAVNVKCFHARVKLDRLRLLKKLICRQIWLIGRGKYDIRRHYVTQPQSTANHRTFLQTLVGTCHLQHIHP